jgi:demethylmenaquinone methyltransferase/2-methoxy-6-polyprenyl-1,4-benzoquinol methylase/phosphoethanolamine N-methyltransferase
VDLLENAISGGRLADILKATLDAAELQPADRLVDVGCGTGQLAVEAARALSTTGDVLGIDATPGMIHLARDRARQQGSSAQFKVGIAEALPLPDEWADAVTSSYFFHHLPPDVKPQAMTEMWRVLKPGGRLIVTDYARPRGIIGLLASLPMRVNLCEYVRPQLHGELEDLMSRFGRWEIVQTFVGYITVFRAVK